MWIVGGREDLYLDLAGGGWSEIKIKNRAGQMGGRESTRMESLLFTNPELPRAKVRSSIILFVLVKKRENRGRTVKSGGRKKGVLAARHSRQYDSE